MNRGGQHTIADLEKKAYKLREDVIKMLEHAGRGIVLGRLGWQKYLQRCILIYCV